MHVRPVVIEMSINKKWLIERERDHICGNKTLDWETVIHILKPIYTEEMKEF